MQKESYIPVNTVSAELIAVVRAVPSEKGKTMREKIKNFIQLGLVIFLFYIGFFTTYAVIWIISGLPIEPWATWVLLALAGLSVYGLVKWIGRN